MRWGFGGYHSLISLRGGDIALQGGEDVNFKHHHYSKVEVNRLSAAAIKAGDIIEIPVDRYRYERSANPAGINSERSSPEPEAGALTAWLVISLGTHR